MNPRRYNSETYGFFEPCYYPSLSDQPRYRGKKRAGITKNKRQGQPKNRRKMAAQSRKINRKRT